MAVPKMAREEREQWQRLYALAERLDQLDPWQWMGVTDCFGMSVPGWEEPCFVIFGGGAGSVRNVRFLLGWKPLYELITRLADPSKQASTWLLEIRMIELLYVNDALLFEHERPVLRTLRRKAGETCATPVFRSIIPGYHPWLPDAKERAFLEVALYQAYGMAMRVEADRTMLKARFPQDILMRRQTVKGVWRDVWSRVKEIGDEEVEVRIDPELLRKVRSTPLTPVTLQVDLVFTPLRLLPDGARPQTAYVLLAVDAQSGIIVAGELLQATEGVAHMWSQIPGRLLQVFAQSGGCPATIEIREDRMANLLRPLGEYLPFKMVRREKLAMLESAREHLSVQITQQDATGS